MYVDAPTHAFYRIWFRFEFEDLKIDLKIPIKHLNQHAKRICGVRKGPNGKIVIDCRSMIPRIFNQQLVMRLVNVTSLQLLRKVYQNHKFVFMASKKIFLNRNFLRSLNKSLYI